MNIQTGVKEAKLMDEPVKEKKGISKELEDALKELNDDSSTLNQQSPDEVHQNNFTYFIFLT